MLLILSYHQTTAWSLHRFSSSCLTLVCLLFVLSLFALLSGGLAFNLCKEVFLTFAETFMSETFLVLRAARLMEIVHVQLAHKRWKVVVFEVLRQNLFSKCVWIPHYKTIACFIPKHIFWLLWVLNTRIMTGKCSYVDYFVCFCQEVGNRWVNVGLVRDFRLVKLCWMLEVTHTVRG